MLKKLASPVLAAALAVSALAVPAQAAGPVNPSPAAVPGGWAKGTDPASIDSKKPVILFVHGLDGAASTWYASNDMYQYAYNNGYQTAFINLNDITGTSQNMWDNGKLLATKIKEISESFGKKLVIVAHSKGGVDTQTALVHYDAYPYVANVVTLGSPHSGSQLADLAYSSEASWLADLIGYKSPGTYSMQTSYMAYFRSLTNAHANVNKVNFYEIAGNNYNNGSFSYFLGGLYLSSYGDNDGVVTVQSATSLPNATVVKIGSWNHNEIKTGTATFNVLKPYLTLNTATAAKPKAALQSEAVQEKSLAAASAPEGQAYFHGGKYSGKAEEKFTVEKGISSITIDWVDAKPLNKLDLIGPDGKAQQVSVKSTPDDGVLKGSWHHSVKINNPKAGQWKAVATSNGSSAYLLAVSFEAKAQAKLNLQQEQKGLWKANLEGLKADKTKLSYDVVYVKGGSKNAATAPQTKHLVQKQLSSPTEALTVPTNEGPGVYNVTTQVEGETTDGSKYTRTLVKSIYVDEQGKQYTK